MKFIKKFESIELDYLEEYFLNIIDLGFTYEFLKEENKIKLSRNNTIDIIEFNNELSNSLLRIKDLILEVKYTFKYNSVFVEIILKSEFSFNVYYKDDNSQVIKNELYIIALDLRYQNNHMVSYKLINTEGNKKNFTVIAYSNGEFTLEFNNRKRGVYMLKQDLEELIKYTIDKYRINLNTILKELKNVKGLYIKN
jgi:hypothetical protein